MLGRSLRLALCFLVLAAAAVRTATAQTCAVIDERRDMLTGEERRAAVLLLARQLETAGVSIADRDCRTNYTISHVRLGTTIVVTLSGPQGSREATALGLDDLPAVYSQLVRSLVTGKQMGTLAVVDRTNVTATQDAAPRRVQSEGFWYARLGYGSLFSAPRHDGASFGLGYRGEFNRVGLDVSFFNVKPDTNRNYYAPDGSAGSLFKMVGLFFTNPTGNHTAYYGGGLSYGWTTLRSTDAYTMTSTGRGNGLQGELTAGYEIARVTSVRVFVQADATLPFYNVQTETYTYAPTSANGRYMPPTITVNKQYAASLAMSIGFGWQRRR